MSTGCPGTQVGDNSRQLPSVVWGPDHGFRLCRFAKYIEQHHLKDVMEHLQTERDALGKDTRTPARTHEVKLTKRHSTASSISTISTGTDIMPSTHEVDTKEATKSHKRFSLEIMPKFPFGSAASVEDLQNTLP